MGRRHFARTTFSLFAVAASLGSVTSIGLGTSCRSAAIDSAARAVIARKGILATTISDIAAEAGRSTASFYNYYDNKEQILEALLGDFATSVVEASLTTGHHDPYEGVTAAVTAYWKMYKEYLPEMIGLQQMALRHSERQLRALAENVPDVVTPIGVCPSSTVRSARNTPRPTALSPRSVRAGPASFSANSASRPQKASFFQPMAQPQRACNGEISRDSSCPCSG